MISHLRISDKSKIYQSEQKHPSEDGSMTKLMHELEVWVINMVQLCKACNHYKNNCDILMQIQNIANNYSLEIEVKVYNCAAFSKIEV